MDGLAQSGARGEELLLYVGAQEGDATGLHLVIPVVEAALPDFERPNLGKRRERSVHRRRPVVVKAADRKFTAQLRHDVTTGRGFLFDREMVRIGPLQFPPSAQASCLQTSAPRKDNHDVFAQSLLLLFDPHPEAFARGHHQRDGNDPPGDAEHRQEGAQLVRPERANCVGQQIA